MNDSQLSPKTETGMSENALSEVKVRTDLQKVKGVYGRVRVWERGEGY